MFLKRKKRKTQAVARGMTKPQTQSYQCPKTPERKHFEANNQIIP